MVIDAKNGDAGSVSPRGSKKTFIDELCSTFSSPLAWILVLALIITWSCVFVIMFDLTDFKTVSGEARALALALASETPELPVLNLLTKNKVKNNSLLVLVSTAAFGHASCVWDNLSETTGSVFFYSQNENQQRFLSLTVFTFLTFLAQTYPEQISNPTFYTEMGKVFFVQIGNKELSNELMLILMSVTPSHLFPSCYS